jgi:phosphatidylglycerophosphatase A
MKITKFKIAELLGTFFYTGKSRFCPGTVGSIATVLLYFLIIYVILALKINPIIFSFLVTILVFCIGYWATEVYITETKKDDPREIVIDEVVGQLLSFIFSFSFVFFIGNYNILLTQNVFPYFLHIFLLITPVIFFRIYDITKPFVIGKIDSKMNNALGIMLDDVVAGIYGGLTNAIVIYLLLKLFFIK